MSASDCPECGNPFHGYKCDCGYKLPYRRKADGTQETAEPTNCAAFGCPNAGTISENTRPPHHWLCGEHWNQPAGQWQAITQKLREAAAARIRTDGDFMIECRDWLVDNGVVTPGMSKEQKRQGMANYRASMAGSSVFASVAPL